MQGNLGEQRDHIIHNLEILNGKVERQMSWGFIFTSGLISGVGFVVGSSILAAIVLGILSQVFGDVPLIGTYLQTLHIGR